MTTYAVKGAGVPLLAGGVRLTNTIPAFKDVIAWNNSWDMNEAVTYTPSGTEQTNYGIDSSLRVASIPDRGSTPLDLVKDPGHYGTIYSLPSAVPGPLYVPASSYFVGRDAASCDQMANGHTTFYGMLTATTSNVDTSKYFNPTTGYSPPYWVALLGDYCDTLNGSTGDGFTLGNDFPGTHYGTACWNLGANGSPQYINTRWPKVTTDTKLFMAYNSGNGRAATDCFIDVTQRWHDGSLVTQRIYGGQDVCNYQTWFIGLQDGAGYLSACGIKTGTPSEANLTAVRSWAAHYIPVGGSGA